MVSNFQEKKKWNVEGISLSFLTPLSCRWKACLLSSNFQNVSTTKHIHIHNHFSVYQQITDFDSKQQPLPSDGHITWNHVRAISGRMWKLIRGSDQNENLASVCPRLVAYSSNSSSLLSLLSSSNQYALSDGGGLTAWKWHHHGNAAHWQPEGNAALG